MVATFIIEITLATYTIWRYKLNRVTRIASTILICLALFQVAEYNICEGTFLLNNLGWAKLGYIAITMLPPLGIHLIAAISDDKRRWIWLTGYAIAAAFISVFLFVVGGIDHGVCLGNYVIFQHGINIGYLYGAYYYGLLIIAICYAFVRIQIAKKRIQTSLWWLIIGYLSFMIPTSLVNIADPWTIAGIPSIMCGFAVILAVVLAGKVMPNYFIKK